MSCKLQTLEKGIPFFFFEPLPQAAQRSDTRTRHTQPLHHFFFGLLSTRLPLKLTACRGWAVGTLNVSPGEHWGIKSITQMWKRASVVCNLAMSDNAMVALPSDPLKDGGKMVQMRRTILPRRWLMWRFSNPRHQRICFVLFCFFVRLCPFLPP